MIYTLEDLSNIYLKIKPGCKIFLYGDLGAGKTTIAKNILINLFGVKGNIVSPTYIHYKKYFDNIYHFDLYRLETYDDFINIGGEEIFENQDNICLTEWPEIIETTFKPDIKIIISKLSENDNVRDIEIIYCY